MPHTFPLILGVDGAGEVAEIGPGVTRFAVGDAVYGQFFHAPVGAGTYAEYVTVPETQAITAAPSNVRPAVAAAVPTAGIAALTLVEEVGAAPGRTVLIVGATGGVGSFATQLAAARGARVIATAGGDAAERIRSYGAAEIVDHHAAPVSEQVPAGIDALIDVVSDAATFAVNAELVRAGGTAATTVFVADVEALAARDVRGVNVNAAASPELLDRLRGEIDAGRLRVPVQAEVPLAAAPEALARVRAGHANGKTVIVL
jgi:NADPH:quinone reductase-like Zn-dependent oxidoreductase